MTDIKNANNKTNNKMAAESGGDLVDLFIKKLEQNGGRCSNPKLMKLLGWGKDKYWEVHALAVDRGLVTKGTGRGGTVVLSQTEDDEKEDEKIFQSKEIDYYEDIKKALEEMWIPQQGYESYIFEITAHQGSKKTGGKWTRPDLLLVATKSYQFLPGRHFEIITFEVKIAERSDITALYESLSHNSFSSRSYIVLVGNDGSSDLSSISQSFVDGARIVEGSLKHGIGILYIPRKKDGSLDMENINEVFPAKHSEYNPDLANTLIATSLQESAQQKIIKWFK